MRKIDKVAEGFKDLLPVERSEIECIARTVLDRLDDFGYEQIETPMVEYADVFSTMSGVGKTTEGMVQDSSSSLKLVDRTGSVLTLRTDMTRPISRVVRTKLKSAPLPLRLSYAGSVFRDHESQRGQQREFRQVGAELIGSDSIMADLEMVTSCIETVNALGLSDARLIVGDSGFISSILRSAGCSELDIAETRSALALGDLVLYESTVKRIKADKDMKKLLLLIPELKGGAEVISKAIDQLKKIEPKRQGTGTKVTLAQKRSVRESSLELTRLLELSSQITAYGYSGQISFDLSLLRPFDYYSGMVFEVLVPGVGFAVGGGGRYDQLYSELGSELRAAGFALSVERLHVAMSERGLFGDDDRKKAYVLPGKRLAAYKAAVNSLQKAGYIVLTDLEDSCLEDARWLAQDQNADLLVNVRSNGRALSEPVAKKDGLKSAPKRGSRLKASTINGGVKNA